LLGWACAASALFTSAGGVITTVAIMGMVVLKLANERHEWQGAMITLASGVVVLGLGVATAAAPIAGHAPLRAHTAVEFLRALAHNIAWPWIDSPQLALIVWLPVGLLLLTMGWRRAQTTELERLVLGLSAWVVFNAGAVAYARGGAAALPATRYMDFLSLGVVANAMAFSTALNQAGTSTMTKRLAWGALAGWLVFATVGVDWLTQRTLADLANWRQFFAAHAANVRRFVITAERAEFTSKRPLYDLPFPDAQTLANILERSDIRRILPAAIRQPLRVEPRVISSNAFVMEGPFAGSIPRDPLARSWWSLSDQGKAAQGRFESRPLFCHPGSRLRFQVSGYLGWEHQYLAVKDLRTGRDVEINPARLARENWTDAVVSCPSDPFEIVAIDATPDSWFGFREPVEVGWASLLAESLIEKSRALLLVALAMAVLAARWS
jgi:hypothetical protein